MNDLIELKVDSKYQNHSKIIKECNYFENLLEQIRKKDIPDLNVDYLNTLISELNEFKGSAAEFKKLVRKNRSLIFRDLEKKHKITPRNYHRNRWIGIGMLIYGVSIGVIFSTIIGNYAFLGIGLPIGMVIGMAIGSKKDNKTKDQGRQLNIDAS